MLRFAAILFLLSCYTPTSAQSVEVIEYAEDFSVFANPERGFYTHTEVHSANYNNLATATLRQYRENQSITQILRVFYLEDFRTKPISESYLNNMRKDFNAARQAGIKVIVRFAYAQSMSAPYNDATPEVVFMHIDQLKPVLRENADVIAVVQAGFIGAWGEWYFTDHFAGFAPSNVSAQNLADRKRVVDELLNALPTDRAVQIRTPGYKMKMYDTEDPLTAGEAFTGTDLSRLGHHNDCFVASSSDFGTYVDPDLEKPYLEQETKFLPMGGETCAVAPPYSDCDFATEELERFHWSYLNRGYNRDVLDIWEDQGCFDEVELRLGYRIRLLNASITTEAQPGGSLNLSLKIINDGYSSPYNSRKVEVILKHTGTADEYYLNVAEDPRRWPVKEEFEVSFTSGLPDEIPVGSYQLFLNLPDPYPSLYNNPAYSIRLANEDVWNDSLGYNDLKTQVTISNEHASDPYEGEAVFKLRTAANTLDVDGARTLYGRSGHSSNLLFWGRQFGYQRVIERATGSGEFVAIASLDAAQDYFKDADVLPDSTYAYRYYLTGSTGVTTYSDTAILALQPEYSSAIEVDGEDNDWQTIAPASTAVSGESYALRIFFDDQQAYFLLHGPVASYKLYLNTDDDLETGASTAPFSGMDYLIHNDSLFAFTEGEWLYTADQTLTATSGELTEIAISHTLFENLASNPTIHLYGVVNDDVILSDTDGGPFTLVRMPPPDLPANFSVSNSEKFNDSRLVLEWDACQYCEGYRIERSENGTDFQELYEVRASATSKNDDKLPNEQTYYYRMYTYNELGESPYSPIVEATVGEGVFPLAVDEQYHLSVYPNPASEFLTLGFDAEKIEVYTLQGKLLLVEGRKDKLDIRSLSKGIYMLRGYTADGIKKIKFIKQ